MRKIRKNAVQTGKARRKLSLRGPLVPSHSSGAAGPSTVTCKASDFAHLRGALCTDRAKTNTRGFGQQGTGSREQCHHGRAIAGSRLPPQLSTKATAEPSSAVSQPPTPLTAHGERQRHRGPAATPSQTAGSSPQQHQAAQESRLA